jgi:hypothetical protein
MRERNRHPFENVPFMTAPERDALIINLRRRGCSLESIGRRVGMTKQGVGQALKRLSAPADPRSPRQGRDPRG